MNLVHTNYQIIYTVHTDSEFYRLYFLITVNDKQSFYK